METENLPQTITPTPETLPPSVSKELEALTRYYLAVEVPVVTDAAQRAEASISLGAIKALSKRITEDEKTHSAPIKNWLDAIRGKFKSAKDALQSAETKTKTAILAYDAEVRRKLEEQARIQQEAENAAAAAKRAELEDAAIEAELSGKDEMARALATKALEVLAAKIGVPEVKLEGERTIWDFEIVDASLVPAMWLTKPVPDTTKIGAFVRGSKGDAEIPGVRIFSRKILAGARV